MSIKEPRRPLVLRQNPEADVSDSRLASRQAIEERLAALTPDDRLDELEMMSEVLFGSMVELQAETEPAAKTAINGLVRTVHKKANWLEAARVQGRND